MALPTLFHPAAAVSFVAAADHRGLDGITRPVQTITPHHTMTAKHCMIALLWSETNPDDNDRPLDCGDWEPSPELAAKVEADWFMFSAMLDSVGFDPAEALAEALHPDCEGDPWNAVAHDFILTRNGHGCGFWDGGWHEPWATRLCQLCKRFGELHCYVGDGDDMIYPER